MEKFDVADSLYRQVFIIVQPVRSKKNVTDRILNKKVASMWYTHLKDVVAEKTEISELDSILGKKDDDDMDKESIGNYARIQVLFF